jgi:hypothetical protein
MTFSIDIQHNDIQHNVILHNDTQHNAKYWYTKCQLISVPFMLSVKKTLYADCHYAECRYAECYGAKIYPHIGMKL